MFNHAASVRLYRIGAGVLGCGIAPLEKTARPMERRAGPEPQTVALPCPPPSAVTADRQMSGRAHPASAAAVRLISVRPRRLARSGGVSPTVALAVALRGPAGAQEGVQDHAVDESVETLCSTF